MTDPSPSSPPPGPASARRDRPGHRPRRWIPYTGAALLAALITAGLWPKATPVEVAPVVSGPLRTTVDEEGRTRIRHRFTVSAPVTGQLQRIPWKPGDAVRAGETIVAVIDPLSPAMLDARSRSLAEARRDAAVAQREKAQAARRFAESELRRLQRLHAEGAVSAQDLDGAQWRDAAAARDLTAAESALRQVEAELAEFSTGGAPAPASPRSPAEVRAPVAGRVLRVFEESARVVGAGAPLVEIGDPADLEIVIEVLSRDGAALGPGTPVILEQWGGPAPLEARVRLIEPAAFTKVSALGVEEQRVRVIADLLTPPDQRRSLGDGFRVEARIVTWETPQTLKVPAGALFRRGDQWAAFVLEGRRARLRSLQAGRSNGVETQILEGLKAGERVILYPGDRVKAGERVTVIAI